MMANKQETERVDCDNVATKLFGMKPNVEMKTLRMLHSLDLLHLPAMNVEQALLYCKYPQMFTVKNK